MNSKTYRMALRAFGECKAEVTAEGLVAAVVESNHSDETRRESLEILVNSPEACRVMWHYYDDGGWGYATRMEGDTFTEREERRAAKAEARSSGGYKTAVLGSHASGAVLVEEGDEPDGRTAHEWREWWNATYAAGEGFVIVTGDVSHAARLALEEIEASKMEDA